MVSSGLLLHNTVDMVCHTLSDLRSKEEVVKGLKTALASKQVSSDHLTQSVVYRSTLDHANTICISSDHLTQSVVYRSTLDHADTT